MVGCENPRARAALREQEIARMAGSPFIGIIHVRASLREDLAEPREYNSARRHIYLRRSAFGEGRILARWVRLQCFEMIARM